MKIKALTSAALSGLLRPMRATSTRLRPVAPRSAAWCREVTRAGAERFRELITVTVTQRSRSARCRAPSIMMEAASGRYQGHRVDAEFGKSMIYVPTETKKSRALRSVRVAAGDAKVKLRDFHLGRNKPGGDPLPWLRSTARCRPTRWPDLALPHVEQAKAADVLIGYRPNGLQVLKPSRRWARRLFYRCPNVLAPMNRKTTVPVQFAFMPL